MSWIPDRYQELRALLRPDRVADDVAEELELHLELRAADLRAAGLTAEAAREEARRRFGDVGVYRSETCAIDESILRERRRMELLDALRRETRHSLRALLRTPVFTMVAVLTLGVGVGATTAIFTLLDAIVLRPLPYPHPDRLVQLFHAVPKVGENDRWGNSVASYFFYGDENRSFDQLGAFSMSRFSLSGDGDAERYEGAVMTASMQRILGMRTQLGRPIDDADNAPGAAPVVLLSHELWQARYHADTAVIGRTINVNSAPTTVIGVAAPGATSPYGPPQLWLPMQLDRAAAPVNAHWVTAFGVLRPGVTPLAAQQDLVRLAQLLPERFPSAYSIGFFNTSGFTPVVNTVRSEVLGGIESVLWTLLGAVALVLLIACANVANLLLVRAEARRREQTVRAALGAERAHFAVHYLTESALLALSAAIVGVSFAYGTIQVLIALAPPAVPRLAEIALTPRAFGFAFLLAAATAALFGLAPLLRRSYDFTELRDSGRGITTSRERQFVRSGLVITQVALAVVLLAAGGLMLRSFMNLRRVDAGFDPANVLTFQTYAPFARYAGRDVLLRFHRTVVERIEALPGVSSVTATTMLPLGGASGCSYTTTEGVQYTQLERPPCIPVTHVLPGYFAAFGIGVHGRTFDWGDVDRRTDGVIVSRAFADRMWPGQDPIGRGIYTYGDGPPWYRVIGVAGDIRAISLDEPPAEMLYYMTVPSEAANQFGGFRSLTFIARTTVPPEDLAAAVRQVVRELDPEVPIGEPVAMERVIRNSPAVARASFLMLLLAVSAVMALFLSAVGLYGVIAYLAGRRRAEIGVRMALGARVSEIARLVLLQSFRLTLAGIVLGTLGALIGTRALRSLLYGVEPADARTLAAAAALLLLVAGLASIIPARRAARTDPAEALRAD